MGNLTSIYWDSKTFHEKEDGPVKNGISFLISGGISVGIQ
jgi:hypothetical protein